MEENPQARELGGTNSILAVDLLDLPCASNTSGFLDDAF